MAEESLIGSLSKTRESKELHRHNNLEYEAIASQVTGSYDPHVRGYCVICILHCVVTHNEIRKNTRHPTA